MADNRYAALFSPNVWNIIARENIETESGHAASHRYGPPCGLPPTSLTR